MQYSLNLIKGRYKIAVWGTGYIGLSTMAFFSRKKVPTVGYDIDEKNGMSVRRVTALLPGD